MAEVLPFVRETQAGGVEPGIAPVVTSRAPRSALTQADIASPYELLGRALDRVGEGVGTAIRQGGEEVGNAVIRGGEEVGTAMERRGQQFDAAAQAAGKGLMDVASSAAERAGLQAVTTDANGNIKVDKYPIVGEAGASYARAMKFAAVTQAEGAAKRDDLTIREQFSDDPQGYAKAANAYRDKMVKQYTDAAGPEVGLTLGKIIDGQTTTTYRGLLNEKERLDLQRAESSMRAGIATAQDNLSALANQGVTSGPEWDKWRGQVQALYHEMAANPRLGVSKDMINYELGKFDSDLKIQGVRYHVDQIYQSQGPAAALEAGKTILTDPSLKLNDVQRRAAFETVRSEINMNESQRRQTVADISSDFKVLKDSGDASPAAIADLHKRFMEARDPVAAAAVVQYGTMRQVIAPFNKLPLTEQQGYIDQLQSKIDAGTASGSETAIAKELKDAKAQTESALKDEGWALVARRFPDKVDRPPPLDADNPQTFAAGIAARAKIAALGENVFQGGPVPVLGKDEVGQFRSALAGKNGAAVLGAVGQALKPDEMQSFLAAEPVRTSITGMSRSGDPAKMNAAYSFMDSQQKANPLQFDKQFPDGLKDLRTWQSNLAFYPPDEAAKRMMRAYDPDQSAARAAAVKVADEQLKAVSADKVVAKFSTGFGPVGTTARAPAGLEVGIAAGALKADYDQNYRDGFTATGDPKAADAFAMEKLQMKYAVSPVNGNRVMAYAPERYYPAIAGSQDWMRQQLDEAVRAQTGTPAAAVPTSRTARGGEVAAREAALNNPVPPYALVADDGTQRDIAAGRPPSYQVITQDDKGRWGLAPKRFAFDPAPLFAARATAMESARAGISDFIAAAGQQAPF